MTDLSTQQKMRVVEAYVDYLRAKAAIGIQPTYGELRLVEEAIEDIQSDIGAVLESLADPMAEVVNAVGDTMQTIAEAFDDE